jgi:hypothetical protein
MDLGLESHVVEFTQRLMPRQLDDRGSAILKDRIESLGVRVHLNKSTKQVMGDSGVASFALFASFGRWPPFASLARGHAILAFPLSSLHSLRVERMRELK